jgi:uncharacterized protein
MKDYILRSSYLEKIKPFIGKRLIKIFVGQRRVGKSYLLYQTMDFIKKNNPKANLIYINTELNEFDFIKHYKELYKYIKSKSVTNETNFLFIDEIQVIESFENALKSLIAEGEFDIYCTGSNAFLLSGELATYLSGRYVEIQVYSLNYNEFLNFHKLENNDQNLELYMKFGGLPYLKHLELTDEIVYEYLKNIHQAIFFKDIVSRYEIRNIDFLNRLVLYLAKNSSTIVSAGNISKYLKSEKQNLSTSVIHNYLTYLSSAFLIWKVRKADIQGKKIFESKEKYYFNDIGIRNSIAGYSPFDLGLIIENLVFLHLKVKGFEILTGYQNENEIDFIAEKHGEKVYLQVALRIVEKQTIEREFGNLLKIKDNYPKYVVTLDNFTGTSYEGIKHIPLRKFLSDF